MYVSRDDPNALTCEFFFTATHAQQGGTAIAVKEAAYPEEANVQVSVTTFPGKKGPEVRMFEINVSPDAPAKFGVIRMLPLSSLYNQAIKLAKGGSL